MNNGGNSSWHNPECLIIVWDLPVSSEHLTHAFSVRVSYVIAQDQLDPKSPTTHPPTHDTTEMSRRESLGIPISLEFAINVEFRIAHFKISSYSLWWFKCNCSRCSSATCLRGNSHCKNRTMMSISSVELYFTRKSSAKLVLRPWSQKNKA